MESIKVCSEETAVGADWVGLGDASFVVDVSRRDGRTRPIWLVGQSASRRTHSYCCYTLLFSMLLSIFYFFFSSFTSLFLIRLPFCCMMRTREEVIRLLTLPTVLWSPLSVRIFDSSYHSTCRLQLLRCYAYMQAIMRVSVYFECRIERTSWKDDKYSKEGDNNSVVSILTSNGNDHRYGLCIGIGFHQAKRGLQRKNW